MKKEKVYNEAVSGDEGFTPGDGYPSCDGEPCANVSDETDEATDTLADGEPAAEADAAKALEEAVAQWQDKYVRLQAEFDNYRKRTLKEKMDLVQTGGRDVLLEMLPVRDDVPLPGSPPATRRRARSSTSFRRVTCWARRCCASQK